MGNQSDRSSTGLSLILFLVAGVILSGITYVFRVRSQHQRERTSYALTRFQTYLTVYSWRGGNLPNGSFQEVLQLLVKSGVQIDSRDLALLAEGRDGWGRPFIYERKSAKVALVRSVGGNGIDEGGQGDDIQRDIPPVLR